jgi:uncharacterized protein
MTVQDAYMVPERSIEMLNKEAVQAGFDRWRSRTGSPFDLLAPEAVWTIVGSSPLSKTYSREEFLDQVIGPFNARLATPLVPNVHGIYADGDMVIILFEASATTKDNRPYHNTYTWYFQMKEGKVFKATAFFDTREFDEFWARVAPTK